MTATADMILERRRVRRRLAFWRILAIVASVVAVISFMPSFGPVAGDHLARITIDGIIVEDPGRERAIMAVAEDDDVRALIVRVNSPGGTVVASENAYQALRRVAAEKPVVAVMDEVAASGGYIAALGADHIFASGNTLTGSVGVVMQAPNISGLMEMVGIGVTRIKSGPLKAEPSLTTPPSDEVIAAQEALIADTFGWFRDLVAERRGLGPDELVRITDGRAVTGRQALELGLVDALGDEEAAVDWLAEVHGIDGDTEIRDWSWEDDVLPWPFTLFGKEPSSVLERLVTSGPRLYAILQ